MRALLPGLILLCGCGPKLVDEMVDGLRQVSGTVRVKGSGLIDIELYNADVEQFVSSEAISSWSTDLGDLDVNRDHYDDVTRTYLFRLEVEDVDVPDQPELRTYFTSRDGAHLQATYKLPTRP